MQDLRTFMATLEQQGELTRIKRPVDARHEVAGVMKRSAEQDGPALLFENVKGSKIPLVANIVAARRRIALALGTTVDDLLETYRERFQTMIPAVRVDKPGQTEKLPGLSALPIIKANEFDAGHYITAGVVFAAHPKTGKVNLSFQRMCPISENELAIYVGETGDLWAYGQAAGNEPLPVAVAIGLHPAFFLVGGTRCPPEAEEIALVGGLLGEAVRLTKSTHGQWIVPEAAEIVIDGAIHFDQTVPEGPFAEYTGYYGGGSLKPRQSPVLKIRSITTKKDPVYQTVITGPSTGHETAYLSPLSKEALLYAKLSKTYPNVRRVTLGLNRYITVVQIDGDMPDETAKQLMQDVFTNMVYTKYVFLIDSDVNAFDPRDVMWAWSTRVDPGKHMHIFPNMTMEPLDPSTPGRCDKLGFDARKPPGNSEGFIRTHIPGVESIRLEDYIEH